LEMLGHATSLLGLASPTCPVHPCSLGLRATPWGLSPPFPQVGIRDPPPATLVMVGHVGCTVCPPRPLEWLLEGWDCLHVPVTSTSRVSRYEEAHSMEQ
jgi:hypothetical protein